MATDTTLPEPARMTKVQKLAALLIMLGPESAAQMLRTFDQPELEAISLEMSRLTVVSQELQQEILCEFADVAVQAVERIVDVLSHKSGGKPTRALNQTGGLKSAADILNSIDKTLSQSVLMGLEKRNPELGAAIRQKMFTFEDLAKLDTVSLQKV